MIHELVDILARASHEDSRLGEGEVLLLSQSYNRLCRLEEIPVSFLPLPLCFVGTTDGAILLHSAVGSELPATECAFSCLLHSFFPFV